MINLQHSESSTKTVLVVLAHPDKRSFNGSWAQASADAATKLGHRVLFSDLESMQFPASESATHYPNHPADLPFDPLKAQEQGAQSGTLPADVTTEIDKFLQADWIIFHFPLWWFAPPAILKGWFDRVLVHGKLHTVDQRFDQGLFKDKKALFCVTTGASESECAFNGKEGDTNMLLWPAAYTLRYLGITVLSHEIIHSVHGYYEGTDKVALESRLSKVLHNQHNTIQNFDTRSALAFNADSDFDEAGTLSPHSNSVNYFIRHTR